MIARPSDAPTKNSTRYCDSVDGMARCALTSTWRNSTQAADMYPTRRRLVLVPPCGRPADLVKMGTQAPRREGLGWGWAIFTLPEAKRGRAEGRRLSLAEPRPLQASLPLSIGRSPRSMFCSGARRKVPGRFCSSVADPSSAPHLGPFQLFQLSSAQLQGEGIDDISHTMAIVQFRDMWIGRRHGKGQPGVGHVITLRCAIHTQIHAITSV